MGPQAESGGVGTGGGLSGTSRPLSEPMKLLYNLCLYFYVCVVVSSLTDIQQQTIIQCSGHSNKKKKNNNHRKMAKNGKTSDRILIKLNMFMKNML